MSKRVLGIFPGEGVGPEVTTVALDVLKCLDLPLEVLLGGPIGSEADRGDGRTLTPDAEQFCRSVFASEGAVLSGPGGGRFVYDCRQRFGLSYKLNPIQSLDSLGPLKKANILVVRENLSGLYQCQETVVNSDVECRFQTQAASVALTAEVAAREAAQRNGRLTLVRKEHGTPETSRLWLHYAEKAARTHGVTLSCLDVDYASYQILRAPADFDVVLTSNCFGDILADLGGHLMGSRGMTYGASFGPNGESIYQTNHGSAWDLAGKNVANPAGHLQSMAWMLKRFYGMDEASGKVMNALNSVFAEGVRTPDLVEDGAWFLSKPDKLKIVGTREFGEAVVAELMTPKVGAAG